jgi:hypothetical protein
MKGTFELEIHGSHVIAKMRCEQVSGELNRNVPFGVRTQSRYMTCTSLISSQNIHDLKNSDTLMSRMNKHRTGREKQG